MPDCSKCTEVDGKCTTGDKNGCECAYIQDNVHSDGEEGFQEYFQTLNNFWDEVAKIVSAPRDSPSNDPSCHEINLSGLRPPPLLSTQSTQKKPKDIMYMVRDSEYP